MSLAGAPPGPERERPRAPGPADDAFPADEVWRRPKHNLGYAEGLRGLGGIASPLLAGFALAATATLVTTEKAPPLAGWAILAFATSVAFLLHAMQLAFLALSTDPSPAAYLQWHPEATVDRERLEKVRQAQVVKYGEMTRYWVTSNVAYDLGLNAFLTGLLLLLVPDDWDAPRIAAFSVAAVALALELWWGLANRIERLPHPVERPGRSRAVRRLDEDLAGAVMTKDRA